MSMGLSLLGAGRWLLAAMPMTLPIVSGPAERAEHEVGDVGARDRQVAAEVAPDRGPVAAGQRLAGRLWRPYDGQVQADAAGCCEDRELHLVLQPVYVSVTRHATNAARAGRHPKVRLGWNLVWRQQARTCRRADR